MNSTRIVKAVDRLKWSTKLVLGLLLKLILLLIWGASIWGIYTLLYDRYVLEAYPLKRLSSCIDILLWKYLGFAVAYFVV